MPASEPVQVAHDDERLLHAAVRDAGALAANHFNEPSTSWTKDDGTPVSTADLAVNDLLKERLLAARPDYGWLSEETADAPKRLTDSRVWVIDPIDGTRSFLERTAHWCVAAALVEQGRPVLGAVYLPLSDRLYSARKGNGAWLDGEPITISERNALPGSRLVARRDILTPDLWQRPWPKVDICTMTSVALRLCLVADGSFDATVAVSVKSDWDLAAGDLIVHEAGGHVSDLLGSLLHYNKLKTRHTGLVACGIGLREQIIHHTSGYKPR